MTSGGSTASSSDRTKKWNDTGGDTVTYCNAHTFLLIRLGQATRVLKSLRTSTNKTPNNLHCKKRLAVFPSPAGMSLTKLSLAGNLQIISGQGEFGK